MSSGVSEFPVAAFFLPWLFCALRAFSVSSFRASSRSLVRSICRRSREIWLRSSCSSSRARLVRAAICARGSLSASINLNTVSPSAFLTAAVRSVKLAAG
jgi:hypothetical protein